MTAPAPTTRARGALGRFRTAMSRGRRSAFIRNVGVLAASQYAAAGVGFATTVIVARRLGPDAYGLAAAVVAAPSLVLAIVAIKATTVVTRYASRYVEEQDELRLRAVAKFGLLVDAGVGAVAMLLVAVLHLAGVRIGSLGRHQWLVLLYAGALPVFSFAGTSYSVLSAFGRFRRLAALQLVEPVLTLVAVTTAITLRPTVTSFVVATSASLAVAGLVWLRGVTTLLGGRSRTAWWRAPLASLGSLRRELGAFLGWSYVAAAVSGVVAQAPILIVASRGSATTAGYLRLATTMATVAGYVEMALSRVAYPELSALHTSDPAGAGRRVRSWMAREGLLGSAAVAITIPALPIVTRLAFGAEYGPMARGVQLLFAGVVVATWCFFAMPYLFASGRPRSFVLVTAAGAAATVAVTWVLSGGGSFTPVAAGIAGATAATRAALAVVALRAVRGDAVRP